VSVSWWQHRVEDWVVVAGPGFGDPVDGYSSSADVAGHLLGMIKDRQTVLHQSLLFSLSNGALSSLTGTSHYTKGP